MGSIGVLALRGLAGGALVVAFALVGEVLKPKVFAGLFAAAPSVALAGLTVTVIAEGTQKAHDGALGMILGGVGMVVCSVIAVWAIPKVRVLWSIVAAWAGWLGVSLGLYWAVLGGGH